MILGNFKTSVLFVFGLVFLAQAHQTMPASGSDAFGSGGSISYTIWQLAYTANIGANNSLAQGVQQVYEISTLWVDDFREIKSY